VRLKTPALVFDLARIEANLAAAKAAADAHGITVLFAAKSFPRREVWELAAGIVDGFDVASQDEADAVPAGGVVSIADPGGRAVLGPRASGLGRRTILSCETPAEVGRVREAEIAIRLSASFGGRDPAIGAIGDGSGHRRSRFGLDVDPERRRAGIEAIRRAAGDRPVGLHIHHGSVVVTSPERFAVTAREALDSAGFTPAFINCGGALHALPDLGAAFAALRAAIPAGIEIVVEPGRLFCAGAGRAYGTVLAARDLDDRPLRVLDLSRICHLRWSQPTLVATPPAPRAGRTIAWVGPTCYEDDLLGEWIADPNRFGVGAPVELGNITGYALAWNTGFGGVAPASVYVI
jgi:diaminopimelate decarboxylase